MSSSRFHRAQSPSSCNPNTNPSVYLVGWWYLILDHVTCIDTKFYLEFQQSHNCVCGLFAGAMVSVITGIFVLFPSHCIKYVFLMSYCQSNLLKRFSWIRIWCANRKGEERILVRLNFRDLQNPHILSYSESEGRFIKPGASCVARLSVFR